MKKPYSNDQACQVFGKFSADVKIEAEAANILALRPRPFITGATNVRDTIWILRCTDCKIDIPLNQTRAVGDRGETLEHGPDDRNRIAEHVGHNMFAVELGRVKNGRG